MSKSARSLRWYHNNRLEEFELKRLVLVMVFLGLRPGLMEAQNFWQAVNNGLGTDTLVRTLVVRANGNIFAGTSEGGYRSTDHGNLWTALIPPGTIEVQILALDPAHLYAGTGHGMFVTTDNGTTWGPINTGFPDDLVLAIAVNSSNGHLFAGTNTSGLFRSTNFGGNWVPLTAGLTSQDITALAYRSQSTILAGTGGEGMFVSTNNGDNWVQSIAGLPDPLILATTVKRSADVFVGTNSNGAFRSTNGGQSWVAVNNNLTNPCVASFVVHPNGDLFAGTSGGGVFRSTNDGATWNQINSGLGNLFVYALAVDSSRYIYAGTAGGGVFRSVQPVNAAPEAHHARPESYALYQNYPNPFNPGTTIRFQLAERARVSLRVYDLLGKEVSVLYEGRLMSPGVYEERFDASALSSGLYLYRLTANNRTLTRKLLVVK